MRGLGVEWGIRPPRSRAGARTRFLVAVVAGLLATSWLWPLSSRADTAPKPSDAPAVRVIVRLSDGATAKARQIVAAVGGSFEQSLPVINGFSATVPADAVQTLQTTAGVDDVTIDSTLHVVVPN